MRQVEGPTLRGRPGARFRRSPRARHRGVDRPRDDAALTHRPQAGRRAGGRPRRARAGRPRPAHERRAARRAVHRGRRPARRRVRRLVRAVPAFDRARCRRGGTGRTPSRHAGGRRSTGWPTSPTSASTSSTSRRSTRSARRTARARTTPSPPAPDDVGSPWAIGAADGGHDAVHPQLGTHDDVAALVAAATDVGLEVALDIAFQCSPDHPWVADPPRLVPRPPRRVHRLRREPAEALPGHRPAGLRHAGVVVAVGRRWPRRSASGAASACASFRVDNPHTKPLAFWEWAIAELKRERPRADLPRRGLRPPGADARAVARRLHPVVHPLPVAARAVAAARLLHDDARAARRSSTSAGAAWPNTPDILTAELQQGFRQVFLARLVLAATLNATVRACTARRSSCCRTPPCARAARSTSTARSTSCARGASTTRRRCAPEIRLVNEIRRTHRALHHDRSLRVPRQRRRARRRLQQDRARVAGAGRRRRRSAAVGRSDPRGRQHRLRQRARHDHPPRPARPRPGRRPGDRRPRPPHRADATGGTAGTTTSASTRGSSRRTCSPCAPRR